MATAWPRVQAARSVAEVRAVLARSPWADPGTDERAALVAALRLAWARRIDERVPELRRWVAALAAVVVAGERFAKARELSSQAAADARRMLGPAWAAPSLGAFTEALSSDARWVLADVVDGASVWRAEPRWWRDLRDEASRQVARAARGDSIVAWSALLLLGDAQRVCGGLEAAAWGPAGLETFDALG
jgi:hypothetical protein